MNSELFYMSHFVIVALFFQIGFPLSGEATAWSKIVRMQRDMSSDLGRDNRWMFIVK